MSLSLTKSFKGMNYYVSQKGPNIYYIEIKAPRPNKSHISIASFYMCGEDKIEKIARHIIAEAKKYYSDEVLSKAESVKLDRYIAEYLKEEDVHVKTLTPIIKATDLCCGCVIIPRDVDIVSTNEIYIVENISQSDYVNCFCLDEKNSSFKSEALSLTSVIQGYLILEIYTDEVKEYLNYKKQVYTMEKFFAETITSIATDINETSDQVDSHIDDFIKKSILDSDYNGLLKERMLAYIEENIK